MSFRILGLDPEPFRHLVGLSDEALHEYGAIRSVADSKPCFPDRIEVRDVEIGESVLLVNHLHQPADTPYQASHAIFISESATAALDVCDAIPEALCVRTLSLRAFDRAHMMTDAELIAGIDARGAIERLFLDPNVAYLQAHFAARGCFAARIERA